MFTFLRRSRASDIFIATYSRLVSLPLDHNCILSRLIFEIPNRTDVGHQGGGGGGNHLSSPLLVREICLRLGNRDEGDGRHTIEGGSTE